MLCSCTRGPQQITFEEPVAPRRDVSSGQVADSTLMVIVKKEHLRGGSSTGFFVAHDKIATNIHAVADADPVLAHVRVKGTTWSIRGVTAYDVKNDLVILEISGEGTPLPLGDSDTVQSGDAISVIGYPKGRYTVREGSIYRVRGSDKWLQMDVRISGGNSGSPVINSKGQVIGIAALIEDSFGYAIPSNVLKALLDRSGPTEPLTQWCKRGRIRAFAYAIQGITEFHANRHDEAVAYFDKAIELNPDEAETYYNRGLARFKLGDMQATQGGIEKAVEFYAASIEDCTHAIELNPDEAETYYNRGLARFKLGDMQAVQGHVERVRDLYKAGIEDCTHAIERNPGDTTAYLNRGLARFKLGELQTIQGDIVTAQQHYQKAIEDWTQMLQLDSENAIPYIRLGAARTNLGDLKSEQGDTVTAQWYYQDAIVDCTQAIERIPGNAMAYNNRGYAKYLLGKSEAEIGRTTAARKCYESGLLDSDKSIQLDSEHAYAYHTRGVIKAALDDFAGAITDFDSAIEINPESAVDYYERGRAKAALGEKEAAEMDFKKAKELDPEKPEE